MEDGFGHAQGVVVFTDVMNAENIRTLHAAIAGEGHGGPRAIFHRRGAEHFADEALARDAEDERSPADPHGIKVPDQGKIVRHGFSKADSGVEREAHGVDSARYGRIKNLSKKFPDFRRDIAVSRRVLHRLRLALHVHRDGPRAELPHHFAHRRIAQSGHVIDDRRAALERGAGDGGFAGVDGDDDGS